jgi:transposase
MCNTESGQVEQTSLFHNPELVRRFYEQFPKAVVGIEASCTARWFENLMNDLGHELRVGNPTQIRARARSRHKSDKRDADLLLDLLLKDEFPALWRRSMQAQSVLEQLRFRHALVKHRTKVCNRLQPPACPEEAFKPNAPVWLCWQPISPQRKARERDQLFELLDDLTKRIKLIEAWLEKSAASDPKVELLLSHKGIGLLSALVVV